MVIIVKTKLSDIPNNCKECYYHIQSFMTSDIGCPLIKDWINIEEWKKGKRKLDNCPLEKINA